MITITDSFRLAYTKIRTRRIRLFFALLISSLLFSILAAGSLIVSGALGSFDKFSNTGFANRYILAGQYVDSELYSMSGPPAPDPAIVAEVRQLETETEAKKVAEAKRLGITYTKDDSTKVLWEDNGQIILNEMSPIVQQVQARHVAEAGPSLEAFKIQVPDAKAYYTGRTGKSVEANLSVVVDGKEDPTADQNRDFMSKGIKTMPQAWSLLDRDLLTPFLLPGQNLDVGTDGSIPIIASYSAAQEVLKLPSLPADASTQSKKERLSDVRERIAGQTFQVCYRNQTAVQEYQSAKEVQASIKDNKSKKDFQMPSYVTAPNQTVCQSPTVERDTRSQAEKTYATKQAEFDKIFGKKDPEMGLLTYRIVGVTPDKEYPQGFSITDILASILMSTAGSNWASPTDTKEKVPLVNTIFTKDASRWAAYSQQSLFFAEFATADAARDAIKTKNCIVDYGGGMPIEPGQIVCKNGERQYTLMPYGSASLAIDDFRDGFRKVQLVVAAVVAGIAAFILMGMIGRIVADARRETAVFRALGASRFSIAQIYFAYTICLAVFITVITLLLGFMIALWVDQRYGADTSVTMALLFNTKDLSMPFHFYGLNLYDLGIIAGVIVLASVIGALVPIAANVRRNPIKDMREE